MATLDGSRQECCGGTVSVASSSSTSKCGHGRECDRNDHGAAPAARNLSAWKKDIEEARRPVASRMTSAAICPDLHELDRDGDRRERLASSIGRPSTAARNCGLTIGYGVGRGDHCNKSTALAIVTRKGEDPKGLREPRLRRVERGPEGQRSTALRGLEER